MSGHLEMQEASRSCRQGDRFPPRASRKNTSLGIHCGILSPQDHKAMDAYGFKPLNLWLFVKAEGGNYIYLNCSFSITPRLK